MPRCAPRVRPGLRARRRRCPLISRKTSAAWWRCWARVREAVLSQPAVGHAITSFLVAEGRRFATTEEGARWLGALRDAPEVERLRQIWEATTLNVFDDDQDAGGVPDAWVDLVADLASIGRVDRIVGALLPEGLA